MKIGIISGLGAAAGIRLYDMLIKSYQDKGAKHDSDFPEIFIHNLASKGMDETGIIDTELMLNDLMDSVRLLNYAGAEIIMIACNSVHVFHKELQEYSYAEILNMVEIAAQSVKTKCVGVISSSSTRASDLYQKSLSENGIKVILTSDVEQECVDFAISNVISGNNDHKEEFILADIAAHMKNKGAEEIILACTELPLAAFDHMEYIDPSKELIKKVMSL